MRAIAAEFFAGSDLIAWPLVALALFIAVFAVALVRILRRDPGAFDGVSRLPLLDDEDDRHE